MIAHIMETCGLGLVVAGVWTLAGAGLAMIVAGVVLAAAAVAIERGEA